MKKKLLNQPINLDAFLSVVNVLAVDKNTYLNEDGDILVEFKEDKAKITEYESIGDDYETIKEHNRESNIPKTVSEGFGLIEAIYNWECSEDEKEEVLADYMTELNRRKLIEFEGPIEKLPPLVQYFKKHKN